VSDQMSPLLGASPRAGGIGALVVWTVVQQSQRALTTRANVGRSFAPLLEWLARTFNVDGRGPVANG
jgi:hypothetical protein